MAKLHRPLVILQKMQGVMMDAIQCQSLSSLSRHSTCTLVTYCTYLYLFFLDDTPHLAGRTLALKIGRYSERVLAVLGFNLWKGCVGSDLSERKFGGWFSNGSVTVRTMFGPSGCSYICSSYWMLLDVIGRVAA